MSGRRLPRRALALALALFGVVAGSTGASAQPMERESPPLPSGAGTILGRVVNPDASDRTGGLEILLYALKPDGTPGVGQATTDAKGGFRFQELSTAPDVVYLLGARYDGVPFGKRMRFEPDQDTLEVEIEVQNASADAAAVEIAESTLQLDWMGAELLVLETHRLRNSGDRVVRIAPAERERAAPVFEALLPEGARGFTSGFGGPSDGLQEEAGRVRYWGPVYTGDQELVYQYRIPVEGQALALRERLERGTGALVVLSAAGGPTVRGADLAEADAVEIDGRSYRAQTGGSMAPGSTLELAVELPEMRRDPDALSLGRSDLWLELDDASLTVSAEHRLEVEPGGQLVAEPGKALLEIPLPPGAELVGIAPDAASMGVRPVGAGLEILGPLSPGASSIGYRYRLPTRDGEAMLPLRFPRAVPTLNVLVADTGVAIESERLHRRRPFRSGTRIYLHREAFQLEPGEEVTLTLRPLVRTALPHRATLASALVALALAAWFVIGPVRRARATDAPRDEPTMPRERAIVYEAIRDLDHDFETGKLAAADHERMRGELRQRAVELLRVERASGQSGQHPAPLVDADDATPGRAAEAPVATTSFCPACGGRVAAQWRFCSHCAATLASADSGSEG